MQRILKATQATLSVVFEVDGIPTAPAPATATVTITRDDGTAIVTNAAATAAGTAGAFSFTLSAAQTAPLDTLTVAWTSSLGTLYTTAEVVGGFLFSISEARAVTPMNNTTTYATARIIATRTLVEEALEDACGVAFVPRYRRETRRGRGTTRLVLAPLVTAIRSVTLDGVAFTAGELGGVTTTTGGVVYNTAGWTQDAAYTIGYEAGYPYAPARVKHVALRLAKRWIVDSPVDDRATSVSTEDGTFSLVTPGVRGAMFDLPEVNAVVQMYTRQTLVA